MFDYLSCIAAAAQGAPSGGGQGGGPSNMIFLLVMLGLMFWFIMIKPDRKRRQEHQRMLDSMKKGDRVVTAGGLHGKVADMDAAHRIVQVEVAPKVIVKVNKTAIVSVEVKDSGKAPAAETKASSSEEEQGKQS
jgi:preprotein translocase subunit YajC